MGTRAWTAGGRGGGAIGAGGGRDGRAWSTQLEWSVLGRRPAGWWKPDAAGGEVLGGVSALPSPDSGEDLGDSGMAVGWAFGLVTGKFIQEAGYFGWMY